MRARIVDPGTAAYDGGGASLPAATLRSRWATASSRCSARPWPTRTIPQRALHAALVMQEELRRYAERLRAEGKIPVEARVGVNTGEVVVRTIETGGHTEYTPVGHVTNLAARMQTAAPGGFESRASEATQRLCEGYFEFRALGPTAVKGLNAPVEVYEVVRAGPLRTHFQLSARRGPDPGSSGAMASCSR